MFDAGRTMLGGIKSNALLESIMRLKSSIIAVFVLFFVFTGASLDYTQTTKIHFGETLEFNDYEIEYSEQQGENTLRSGKWTETSFHVLTELQGNEIYESEGEELKASENLTLEIQETGFDQEGRFIRLQLSSTADIFSAGDLSSSTPDNLIISQGESSEIPLTIENTGLINQSYDLGYRTNSSIAVSFSFQEFNVTNVYVPSGEENSLTAELEVPQNAELGTYDVVLTAEDDSRLSESFQIDVRGREMEKDISVDINQRFEQVEPGSTVEIPVTVVNGGTGFIRPGSGGPTLKNVQFDIGLPDSWDYELRPEGFSSIEHRDRERSRLIIEVPENAETGDYFVDVSASSDETSMDEPEEIRVNVQERSQMGIVGAILMAVSFGLLAFVYRKFGRR
ncbi:MAG: putative membrane protein [Candidatus Nanohaloarchaea archaeon]|jgi:uncharacterized membrane protein